MATGTLKSEFLDAFPKVERVNGSNGGPKGPRETDVDIVLKALLDEGQVPSRVVLFMDYNFSTDPETGYTSQVDSAKARQRASGRVGNVKARGYDKAHGWVVKAINGAVYAQFVGEGGGAIDALPADAEVGVAV